MLATSECSCPKSTWNADAPKRFGFVVVLAVAIAGAAPADATPCGFDDPAGADILCEVSFDGAWRPATDPGGQPNRTNVLRLSPEFAFFNNFSEPVGIDFDTERDFESAHFASRGTPLLTIARFRGGDLVASRTIDFRAELGGSGFFVFDLYTFDSTFDRIDALEFHPTTFGFPAGFGEFFLDDATIVTPTPAGAIPEPTTLLLMGPGLAVFAFSRRLRRRD